ncbi:MULTISPECIES: hypothetical protein [Ralstonia]|jgi:hypothetical protein|uniref:Uncharacterized protein n=4 Tax=Pseudomonadota TaxID=1224 RepID=R0E902_RALPI|nr:MULTISPECIES: hypothetical protein [Ralstonia]ENZ77882.1 hypothetical protein OR214_02158 [Ralstonia pickettii OR214]MBL4777840.1 hypothetical protein [Ralstonia sp.]MCM3582021.1 hypothetical protein [Ralstonia pickettii]MDR9384606.1 hypothetical protein [Ralstonia sp. 11b]OCS50545.1 hypothetical protein BEK68_13760 [Ralstonia pickettii]
MREYRTRTISEVVASTCNRCQRHLSADEPGEWQERLSFDHSCGFDSVFGDGNTISLDLCQHCVQEVLGEWLRITKSADIGGPNTLAQALMDMPDAGEDADFARNPCDTPRESAKKYEAPAKSMHAPGESSEKEQKRN